MTGEVLHSLEVGTALTQESQQLPAPVRMDDLVGRDQSDTPVAGHVTEALLNLVAMTETPKSPMIEPS